MEIMTVVVANENGILQVPPGTAAIQEPDFAGQLVSESEIVLTVIEPQATLGVSDLKEYWRYRELLFFLTWRDIAVRYKQSLLGAAWAILQPLSMMIMFSVFLGRLVSMPTNEVPYPIFVLAGLLPWFLFSNGLASASQSVVGNQNLVTKIYFPRLLIPIAAVTAGLVDFVIALVLLALTMLVYGVVPGWTIILLPLLLVGLVAATAGIGFLLAALTVQYRDFRFVVPFMVQLWMFMTPCIYMSVGTDTLDGRLLAILPLNPAYGLIQNFRVAVLGGNFDYYALTISLLVSAVLLFVGCWYFRRVQRTFADCI
jgi:lipopolysaccharide transport system permease protein